MGELSCDEMARKFIEQEEQTFELFTSVNQLKRQAESVETEIINLQGTIDQANSQNVTAKGRAIAQLDEKLRKTAAQKEKVEEELKQTKDEIDQVLKVITKLATQTLKLESELQETLAQIGKVAPVEANRKNY